MTAQQGSAAQHLSDAKQVLTELGMPRAQRNERSALCLLALLDLRPGMPWERASSPLMGITPIMDWMRDHYGKAYKPNTRETVRRQSIHQFVDAGIALYNPDDPQRAVNSKYAAYQVTPEALALMRSFGTDRWRKALSNFLNVQESLAARYARARDMNLIPVTIADGKAIQLSSGEHSELIKAIVEEFAPRFAPGAELIYVGDTGDKWGYFAVERLKALGVKVNSHGKMPDVVIYHVAKNWLLLIESVTSHGPVDGKRRGELARLFGTASAGLVYVTAFPSRRAMKKYLTEVSWETEVWCAEAPTHLIHFNGERFLGPYPIDLSDSAASKGALPRAGEDAA